MRRLFAIPLLCACQEDWCARFDLVCPGPVVESLDTTDRDGDGWIVAFDCVDSNAAINPQELELCNGVDDDCDGAVDEDLPRYATVVDVDGDGFGVADGGEVCLAPGAAVPRSGDCDETDVAISPAAAERCDGIDNNCDGRVDVDPAEGGVGAWPDEDGDGYGQEGDATLICPDLPGWTAHRYPSDCDDSNPDIAPDHIELCNGIDDDCDNKVDSDDIGDIVVESGGLANFLDADGDGYGVGPPLYRCERMVGYTTVTGDCDDTDPALYPGAVERCDGIDNNCNRYTDSPDDPFIDPSLPLRWQDHDRDGFGDAATSFRTCDEYFNGVDNAEDCDDADARTFPHSLAEDCEEGIDRNCDGEVGDGDLDGDGFIACLDCDDARGDVSPAAQEVCDPAQTDEDCDGAADDADEGVEALLAFSVDADEDGHGGTEVVWACHEAPGRVTVADDCDDAAADAFPGATEHCGDGVDVDCAGTTDACIWAEARSTASVDTQYQSPTSILNGALLIAEDLTAEGGPALVVGAGWPLAGGSQVLLHSGWTGGGSGMPSGADARLVDLSFSGTYGSALAGGADLTGDGLPDLAVGSYNWGVGGAVTVFDGPFTGLRDDVDAVLRLTSPTVSWNLGLSLAVLDGEDGLASLWVGGVGDGLSTWGTVWGLDHPQTGVISINGAADVVVTEERPVGYFAINLVNAGDLDGDGLDELLLSTGHRSDTVSAVLFRGPVTDGTVADADLVVVSGGLSDGAELAPGRDVDGDGHDDLFLGDLLTTAMSGRDGSAVVFLGDGLTGPSSVAWTDADGIYVGDEDESMGSAVAFLSDPSDPLVQGLLIGGYDSVSSEGRVYWEAYAPGTHQLGNKVLEGAAHELIGGALVAGDLNADGREDYLARAVADQDSFYLLWAGD